MTDPRVTPEFEGVDAKYAGYVIDDSTITHDATKAGGSDQVGLAVTLTADRTVGLVADAGAVEGKLIKKLNKNLKKVKKSDDDISGEQIAILLEKIKK